MRYNEKHELIGRKEKHGKEGHGKEGHGKEGHGKEGHIVYVIAVMIG